MTLPKLVLAGARLGQAPAVLGCAHLPQQVYTEIKVKLSVISGRTLAIVDHDIKASKIGPCSGVTFPPWMQRQQLG